MITTLKNKLVLGLLSALLILAIASFIMFKKWRTAADERDRFKQNYTAVVSDRSLMQELTKKEFKRFYARFDSLAGTLNIKTRNIKDVLTISYQYKDTSFTSQTLLDFAIDTATTVKSFTIDRPCYSIQGYISNDSIKPIVYANKDCIDLFLFRQYTRKFLFIKWKPVFKSAAYSECRKDTIAVKNFIHLK